MRAADGGAAERAHLLVVDDDARLRSLLERFLKRRGFRVSAAADAANARELLEYFVFDLIVLDVMMPGENGFEFAAALRAGRPPQADAPILMLTAQAGGQARIDGFQAGVDDYLSKPFDPQELALRIEAILRRVGFGQAQRRRLKVEFGDCRFDLDNGVLLRAGAPVALTSREQDLLKRLARARGQAVARAELLGPDFNERSSDVQINRLRRKIEPNPAQPVFLQTVRGIGYRLIINP